MFVVTKRFALVNKKLVPCKTCPSPSGSLSSFVNIIKSLFNSLLFARCCRLCCRFSLPLIGAPATTVAISISVVRCIHLVTIAQINGDWFLRRRGVVFCFVVVFVVVAVTQNQRVVRSTCVRIGVVLCVRANLPRRLNDASEARE